MRPLFVALAVLILPVAPITSVNAQFSVNIGVNVSTFPDLVPVPGYPVYYDPFLESNYFFYDGQYWVYDNDNWYTSDWYNGPWLLVEPDYVPVFILRVPVRYYRRPPTYFGGWMPDRPPRWQEHWGHDWESHHRDWDRWNHEQVPRPAPLPTYQRQFTGDRYPHPEEQHVIREQHYQYKPREPAVQHRRQQIRNEQPTRQNDAPSNSGKREAQSPPQQLQPKPQPQRQPPPVDIRRQSQPLPEQPPEVQRPTAKPERTMPREEPRRPQMNRPQPSPPVVHPEPPPPIHEQRPPSRPMPVQREAPRPAETRPPIPPHNEQQQHEQHQPSPPREEKKRPPHRDE